MILDPRGFEPLNLGSTANDGRGDAPRDAGAKLNRMLAELFARDALVFDLDERVRDTLARALLADCGLAWHVDDAENQLTVTVEDPAALRAALDLGGLARRSTIGNADWRGEALAIANGGTGAFDVAGARGALGLAYATDAEIAAGTAGRVVSPAHLKAALAALVAGSPALLDTLREFADAIGNDPGFAATTAAALGNRVRVDAAQAFSPAQRSRGLLNLGAQADLRPEGVTGAGVVGDGAALAAAGGGILPAGTYLIDQSATIGGNWLLMPGARFAVAAGRTLTITGHLTAPIDRIFTGLGTVTMRGSATPVAYPEWWGGAPVANVDYLPALKAAVDGHPRVQLLLRDYYIADTLVIDRPRTKLAGLGIHWGAIGTATRIVVMGASADAVRMGPAAPPMTNGAVDINALHLDMRLESVEVVRDRAPLIGSGCVGVRVQYTQDAVVERVKAQEHMRGFVQEGTVNTRLEDDRAYRTMPGTGPGTDYFHGFEPVTGAIPLTAINGNASTWIERCICAAAPAILNTAGLYLAGRWTDTFVDQFETAGTRIAIQVEGDGPAVDGGAAISRTNANLHITRLRGDQFADAGLSINNLNRWGAIEISAGCYLGPSPGADAAIRVTNSHGAVTISSGELAMAVAGSASTGVKLVSSSKVALGRDLKIMECGYRAVALVDCANITDEATSINETNTLDQRLLMQGANKVVRAAPKVCGAPGKVGYTIAVLDGGTTRSTFDVSEIDSTTCAAASVAGVQEAAKLYFGPKAGGGDPGLIVAAGTFGNGNLAAGNFK